MKKNAIVGMLMVIIVGVSFVPLAYGKEDKEMLKPDWWVGDDFSWVRGANYVASYALNDVAMWKDYDPNAIDRELEFASRLRINSVRVFLQYLVYELDREKFLRNYEDFLTRCAAHGIRPMIVLFDGCFGADPTPDATIWVANPGPKRMVKEYWTKLEKYLDDVVGRYVGDPRILFWDVMNEPSSLGVHEVLGNNPKYAWDFARAFCDYVNKIDKTHPTTVGVGHHSHIPDVWDHVDVVTYHNYQPFEKAFDIEIAAARNFSRDKAVLITETVPNSMGQDPEMTFRVLRKHNIGWYFWSLVIGKLSLTADAVYTTDGITPWPDYVASILGFTVPRQVMPKRLDRFRIAEICDEVTKVPTTSETYDERRKAMMEFGRSLGWANVGLEGLKDVIQREGKSQELLKEGKKEEAYKLFDENVKALGQIARENGFFDELKIDEVTRKLLGK